MCTSHPSLAGIDVRWSTLPLALSTRYIVHDAGWAFDAVNNANILGLRYLYSVVRLPRTLPKDAMGSCEAGNNV